ncbi:hypothetical protein ACOKFD_02635 [Flagellimonas sp. S174]
MNTKKVFFGVLAVAFLAMAAVSTNNVPFDIDQKAEIDRGKVLKL